MITQKERIERKLYDGLSIEYLELRDDSGHHSDHYQGSENIISHLTIVIWAEEFYGLSMLAQHSQVNNLIADEFNMGLHALRIKIKKPEDINNSKLWI